MGQSKKDVGSLAADFRTKIVGHAIKATAEHGAEWLHPVCVLTATGCRPAELEKGVRVRMGKEPGTMEFIVAGAKINREQNRGIAIRIVKVTTHDAKGLPRFWAQPLLDLVKSGTQVVSIASPTAFGTRITEASRRLWPRRRSHASPYSFRHAMCSDLKSAGLDPVTIAKVMGHASTRASLGYGRRSKGGGGESPIFDVETSKTPRHSKDRLARFKVKATEFNIPTAGQMVAKVSGGAPQGSGGDAVQSEGRRSVKLTPAPSFIKPLSGIAAKLDARAAGPAAPAPSRRLGPRF